MPRLVYVVTHPVTADLLLRGQPAFMRRAGFDVKVVSSPGPELDRVRDRENVETFSVPMRRDPSATDPRSLAQLTTTLRRLRPDIVHASTPKAGLLGMLAARAIRCRARVYLLRGLRLETATGTLRRVLGVTERIASACAHAVPCVSSSLRDVAVAGGWVPARKACIVGAGSSNGVDAERFCRTEDRRREGARLLGAHGIEEGDFVIGFVGRPVADKGIAELLDAFTRVSTRIPRARLVVVGGGLAGDALERRALKTESVSFLDAAEDLAPYYARFDVLAFPSRREGFPNVPLEAACAEVPVVGFRATGVVDAIEDGKTGTLVPLGDVAGFADAIVAYAEDPPLRRQHGSRARARAEVRFAQTVLWREWLTLFERLLASPG